MHNHPFLLVVVLSILLLLAQAEYQVALQDTDDSVLPVSSKKVKAGVADSFDESLQVYPASDRALLLHFDFITKAYLGQDDHYNLLSRAIGQTIRRFDVRELHLTFTHGRWDYHSWIPHESNPTGVQIWAKLGGSKLEVDRKWKGLVSTLAGIFCTSLQSVDHLRTAKPTMSFASNSSQAEYRFGILPRETVCTENLTPWLKLLPCNSLSGLASLVNAYKIFDNDYSSMLIDVQSTCLDPDCEQRNILLKQSLVMMMNPLRQTGKSSWSFQSLFDKTINSVCLVANTSAVSVLLDDQKSGKLEPTPRKTTKNKKLLIYDAAKGLYQVLRYFKIMTELPLNLEYTPSSLTRSSTESSNITIQRFLTGYGMQEGVLEVEITNHGPEPANTIYLDILPWYMKIYLHTMKFDINGSLIQDAVRRKIIQRAVDRQRPNILEFEIAMPPQSRLIFTVNFDKVLLRYTEYPPDANRGFDLPSAMLTVRNSQGDVSRIYTQNLLLVLPTPDFSMPYNVITLTSTVIALLFGSLFNLLLRSFTINDGVPSGLRGVIYKLVMGLKRGLLRYRTK